MEEEVGADFGVVGQVGLSDGVRPWLVGSKRDVEPLYRNAVSLLGVSPSSE